MTTILERTYGGLPGIEALRPTPAGRAARWYLGAAVPGAPLPGADEVADRVALVAAGSTPAEGWAGFFSVWQGSDWAVAEILGADTAERDVTVAVRAVDGRVWDITLTVDESGRITDDCQSRRRCH